MTPFDLLEKLKEKNILLSETEGELIVRGGKRVLDASLLSLLRENKESLIELIRAGKYVKTMGVGDMTVAVPPNLIPAGCEAIDPAMLPLLQLTAAEVERIVTGVPGGASNVQDIYPLAPLQEGILFHHLMATQGDPYLLWIMLGFNSRARLNAYLDGLQAVVNRHDILRTALMWDGLPEPVQVVWRDVRLVMEEVVLDPALGDVAEQLRVRFAAPPDRCAPGADATGPHRPRCGPGALAAADVAAPLGGRSHHVGGDAVGDPGASAGAG